MALQIGIEERNGKPKKYLSLRTGRICETSNKQEPGFTPAFTENQAGKKTEFFAREHRALTAYVDNLSWYEKTLDNGTVLKGWQLLLNVGDPDFDYIFSISEKERPFHHFMSSLANCDLAEPIKFLAFKDEHDRKKLYLYQAEGEKPPTIKPKYPERWLNSALLQKLREMAKPGNQIKLTDDEKSQLAYGADGRMLGIMKYDEVEGQLSDTGYPYIVQKADGKWNWDAWTEFLKQKVTQDVIPAIKEAAAQRLKEGAKYLATAAPKNVPDDPFGNLPDSADEPVEDIIPF